MFTITLVEELVTIQAVFLDYRNYSICSIISQMEISINRLFGMLKLLEKKILINEK